VGAVYTSLAADATEKMPCRAASNATATREAAKMTSRCNEGFFTGLVGKESWTHYCEHAFRNVKKASNAHLDNATKGRADLFSLWLREIEQLIAAPNTPQMDKIRKPWAKKH
jgi:hypothetical protein